MLKSGKLEGGLRTKSFSKKIIPDKPFISVITIVFNGEKEIEKTIQSVLEQSYKNFEYIIIDGGSTDSTIDIIKQYENKVDYWLSEPDHGIYDAMNKGIELAGGEWIIFMNAGDYFFEKDILSRVFSINLASYDLVYGHCEVRYEGYAKIIQARPLHDLWTGMNFYHQSSFVKTALMKQYKFNTRYKIAADFDFVYQIFLKKHAFKDIDITISSFDAGGVSGKKYIQTLKEQRDSLKKHPWKNAFLIRIYYTYAMVNHILRQFFKKILPSHVVMFIISKKSREKIRKL